MYELQNKYIISIIIMKNNNLNTTSQVDYIKKSNINFILKWVYLKNKNINPKYRTTPPIYIKCIKRKSSVSHYNI